MADEHVWDDLVDRLVWSFSFEFVLGVLEGFTISLDGGLEEVEEFLPSFASWASSSTRRFCIWAFAVCSFVL